jgi:AcrR family transcriptional regulator
MNVNARSDSTRAKILEGAEKAFSEHGVDGTSMEELAKVAGVNKALLFYHFKNKAGLLKELCAHHLEDARALVTKVFSSDDKPKLILDNFIDEINAFIAEKRHVVGIMFSEALKKDQNASAIFELLDPVFKALLEAARKKRFKTSYSAEDLVVAFFMKTAPLLINALLGESFAKFYGIPAEKVGKLFLDSFRTDLESSYLPE